MLLFVCIILMACIVLLVDQFINDYCLNCRWNIIGSTCGRLEVTCSFRCSFINRLVHFCCFLTSSRTCILPACVCCSVRIFVIRLIIMSSGTFMLNIETIVGFICAVLVCCLIGNAEFEVDSVELNATSTWSDYDLLVKQAFDKLDSSGNLSQQVLLHYAIETLLTLSSPDSYLMCVLCVPLIKWPRWLVEHSRSLCIGMSWAQLAGVTICGSSLTRVATLRLTCCAESLNSSCVLAALISG